ncbi:MAG: hypothetical protein NT094_02990 [Candidatus Staskawiczbacteria bacterium]|nr:hypothetical protein [Candidatus Staskawiczbacteria bacterium]
MGKRKIWGIIVVILGLILTVGSMGSVDQYGAVAPITMFIIVLIGFAMIFWDKIKGKGNDQGQM